MIGFCNGLIFLYHDGMIVGGAVTLVNPVTCETADVSLMPCAALFIA
jgi:hypothetical protein